MSPPLSSLFALYTLTPGRRIYALGRVADRAKAMQVDELLGPIEAAINHDRVVLELDARRADRSRSPGARKHDIVVDRTLGAIEGLVSHFAASNDDTATALLGAMFPTNLADHVHLAFIEQSAANERVLAILEGPEHESWIDAHGVRPLAVQLREAHDSFAEALHTRDAETVPTWDEVKAARETGQELYVKVVVRIVAKFIDDAERRDELLEPIWTQNQRIRNYRRQRRKLVDVDPETGEVLEDDMDVEVVAEVGEAVAATV